MNARPGVVFVLFALFALLACDKKEASPSLSPSASAASSQRSATSAVTSASAAPTTSASSTASVPPTAPGKTQVAATADGFKGTLDFARVTRGEWFPMVTLSTKEIACGKQPEEGTQRVDFPLLPGPGGKFYASTGYRPSLRIALGAFPETSDPVDTLVRLDPVALTANGRVNGTVAYDAIRSRAGKTAETHVNGPFSAVVCEAQEVAPLDDAAPQGPVKGTDTGTPFESKSAIAILREDDRTKVHYIDRVVFFARAGVSCETMEEAKVESFLTLQDLGGLTSKDSAPTPVLSASAILSDAKSGAMRRQSSGAWVKVDGLELKEGGTVKGAMVAMRKDKKPEESSKIGGHFEAKVCR